MAFNTSFSCKVITNSLLESRLTFDGVKESNASKKQGIRFHNDLTAFFLKIFGKTVDIQDVTGKIYHLNRGSLIGWMEKQGLKINKETSNEVIANLLKNFDKTPPIKIDLEKTPPAKKNESSESIASNLALKSHQIGQNKGFQGENNSCGICTVLFMMFGATKAYDFLLKTQENDKDDQKTVREELSKIVNRFRKNGFVPAADIEGIRNLITPINEAYAGKIDIEQFYNELLRKLLSDGEVDLYAEQPNLIDFELEGIKHSNLSATQFNSLTDEQRINFMMKSQVEVTTTQNLIDGLIKYRHQMNEPLPKLANAIRLDIPRIPGKRLYKQVLPSPEITIQTREGSVTWKLASIATIGDYDPSNKTKISEAHYVAFSFDENGHGYSFDSMADRVDEVNEPEIRKIPGFLGKLQSKQSDDKTGQDRDVRKVLFNLRSCIYVRVS